MHPRSPSEPPYRAPSLVQLLWSPGCQDCDNHRGWSRSPATSSAAMHVACFAAGTLTPEPEPGTPGSIASVAGSAPLDEHGSFALCYYPFSVPRDLVVRETSTLLPSAVTVQHGKGHLSGRGPGPWVQRSCFQRQPWREERHRGGIYPEPQLLLQDRSRTSTSP